MPGLDELVSQIPISQLAGQLGLSEAETENAVRQSLPALVGGMQANAADPAGAASLEKALGQHDGSLLEGGVDINQIDTDDGDKIVSNVFGENKDAVVNQLGGLGGLSGDAIGKLLPMLAPIVMSFLGKTFGGGSKPAAAAGAAGAAATSSGIGDDGGSGAGSGGGIGDLLGGLLGGSGGGIGDLLGGLLGGGKK